MILINTTFVIDRKIEDGFLKWHKESFVQPAFDSGIFTNSRLVRVLSNEDPRSISFASELSCESLSEGSNWYNSMGALILAEMGDIWGDGVLCFTTYLRTVE